MHKYIIMGPPGSGKGTQAQLLEDTFDLVHIGVGDILRWHILSHTKLAARIRRLVAAGDLVPDEMVEEVVRSRLDQHDWNYGFILDGFPRDRAQAEFFLESYDIDAVIWLAVPDEVAVERALKRRVCQGCGLDYGLIHHRPAAPDACDVCGGALVSRPDDTPEAIRTRLKEYHARTEPVLELFRRKELVVVIDGTRPPAEVQQEIRRKLGLDAATTEVARS